MAKSTVDQLQTKITTVKAQATMLEKERLDLARKVFEKPDDAKLVTRYSEVCARGEAIPGVLAELETKAREEQDRLTLARLQTLLENVTAAYGVCEQIRQDYHAAKITFEATEKLYVNTIHPQAEARATRLSTECRTLLATLKRTEAAPYHDILNGLSAVNIQAGYGSQDVFLATLERERINLLKKYGLGEK